MEGSKSRTLGAQFSRIITRFVSFSILAGVVLCTPSECFAQQKSKQTAAQQDKKSKSKKKKKAASQPASETDVAAPAPENETVAAAAQRYARIPAKKVTREDAAWRAGLSFLQALSSGGNEGAAELVDAAGYNPLPFQGELPENPDKPLLGKPLRERIEKAGRPQWSQVTLDHFQLLKRRQANEVSPTVATWMLDSQDYMLVYRPPTSNAAAGFEKPACVIVRMRAKRPAIVGGTVLPG